MFETYTRHRVHGDIIAEDGNFRLVHYFTGPEGLPCYAVEVHDFVTNDFTGPMIWVRDFVTPHSSLAHARFRRMVADFSRKENNDVQD